MVGADPDLFTTHARGKGVVGMCSGYQERKQPELMHRIIAAMPHRQFILLGRWWQRYARFEELCRLPNFQYWERPYSDYPKFYSSIDVFVSPSRLEGGPVPLLEAMMSNCVPVASRTGFAPDLIRHGENGFLFETDVPTSHVAALIDAAFDITADVRRTVEDYTWERTAGEVRQLLLGNDVGGNS
jgi:glycosyltransferase involved in cell wall biosynthesis